jgi:hypothetical protein
MAVGAVQTAQAQNSGDTGPFHWKFKEASGTLTISGQGVMPDYEDYVSPWHHLRASIAGVNIENGATAIGYNAFQFCSNMESVSIPNSVQSIGMYAFYSCSGLTSITCETAASPVIYANTFNNVDKYIPVSVSCGSEANYQAATGWKDFTDYSDCISGIVELSQAAQLKIYPNPVKNELRIESGELTIENVEIADLQGKTVSTFNNAGNKINVSHLSAGIYLLKIKTDKGVVTGKFVKE